MMARSPVVVRTLVPITGGDRSFNGMLTGGAIPGNQGQRITFQFEVPNGMPSLNVSVQLRDPNVPVFRFLTDPDGEPLGARTRPVDLVSA
jgi:hypothetical protein